MFVTRWPPSAWLLAAHPPGGRCAWLRLELGDRTSPPKEPEFLPPLPTATPAGATPCPHHPLPHSRGARASLCTDETQLLMPTLPWKWQKARNLMLNGGGGACGLCLGPGRRRGRPVTIPAQESLPLLVPRSWGPVRGRWEFRLSCRVLWGSGCSSTL